MLFRQSLLLLGILAMLLLRLTLALFLLFILKKSYLFQLLRFDSLLFFGQFLVFFFLSFKFNKPLPLVLFLNADVLLHIFGLKLCGCLLTLLHELIMFSLGCAHWGQVTNLFCLFNQTDESLKRMGEISQTLHSLTMLKNFTKEVRGLKVKARCGQLPRPNGLRSLICV